jgi:sulfate adenylyltransferase subunit 1 (EFTu-like GTPase family)
MQIKYVPLSLLLLFGIKCLAMGTTWPDAVFALILALTTSVFEACESRSRAKNDALELRIHDLEKATQDLRGFASALKMGQVRKAI